MATLLASLFRKPSSSNPSLSPSFPFTAETNPYRCKRTWPPDFTHLSPKHQFRLERRYRRRAKLKWARPGWTKGVKLVQWASIAFVVGYGVLFMQVEGNEGRTPFDGIRRWYGEQIGSMAGMRESVQGEGHDGDPVASRVPS